LLQSDGREKPKVSSIFRRVWPLFATLALLSCGGGRDAKPTGEQLYLTACSGCHGSDAHGNGPASPFINVLAPDLTRIAARRGGAFPADEIYRIIDGQSDLLPSGARHMPVWGYEFFDAEEDDQVAHQQAIDKVQRLVSYLRSLQRSE
jgi:mono/diheme cytochrome c family protein